MMRWLLRALTVAGIVVTSLAIASDAIARDATAVAATAGDATAAETRHLTVADTLTLGVLPFETSLADSALRPLGFALADLIASDIASLRRVTVVEQTRLGDVLRELEFARSALVDPATAPRTGRLLGANRLVLGSLVRAGGDLVFAARIVNTGSGVVDTALRPARVNPNDILVGQKAITLALLGRLGMQLSPRERTTIEQRPTRSLAALLAYGQGVEEELNGNFSAARRSFRRASSLDPGFNHARTRMKQSEMNAIRREATLVSRVVDNVNPSFPGVPRSPQPGLATDPVFAERRGFIVITFTRP